MEKDIYGNYIFPIRRRPFSIKGYIILGYNEFNHKYYGIASNGSVSPNKAYLWQSSLKKNISSLNEEIKRSKDKDLCNLNPNSGNQLIYFLARNKVRKLNKSKFYGLTWKVYRINSKHCPVFINDESYKTSLLKRGDWRRLDNLNVGFINYTNE